MDIFFTDPNDVPLPPEEIKIRSLEARPYPDRQRIAVRFEITPFLQRPNLELAIYNQEEREVSNLSVVEAIENRMTFVMHLKEAEPSGEYRLKMRVFYSDLESFELGERTSAKAHEILEETGTTVASDEAVFTVPFVDEEE